MSSFDPWPSTDGTRRHFVPLDGSSGREAREVKTLASILAPEPNSEPEHDGGAAAAHAAFAQGVEEGRRQAREETGALIRQLEGALAEIGACVRSIEKRYGGELMEIALTVAEKILRAELKQRPEQWLPIIQEGIRQAVDRETVQIRVAQPLYGFLVSRLPRLRELVEEAKTIDLVEDPGVGDSGCIIETLYGEVDVGLKTQLGAARAALRSDGEGT